MPAGYAFFKPTNRRSGPSFLNSCILCCFKSPKRKSPATSIHKVRHGTLPLGIPSDNTPRGIVDQIDTWAEKLISDGKDEEGARIQAMIEVACKVARDFQWEVRLDVSLLQEAVLHICNNIGMCMYGCREVGGHDGFPSQKQIQ